MTPKEQIQVLWEYSQSAYLCTTISITRGDPTKFLDTNCGIYNSQRAYNYMRKYSQRAYLFCGSTSRMLKSVFGKDPDSSATCSGIPKNIR